MLEDHFIGVNGQKEGDRPEGCYWGRLLCDALNRGLQIGCRVVMAKLLALQLRVLYGLMGIDALTVIVCSGAASRIGHKWVSYPRSVFENF